MTDERVIELICEQFEEVRERRFNDYYRGYNFTFCVDGKEYNRYFYVNESKFDLIMKYLLEDKVIANNYRTLPEYSELESVEIIIEGKQYIGDDIEEIYKKYKEDLKQLSNGNIIKNINNDSFRDRVFIEICYIKDKEHHYLQLPILEEMQDSYNEYLEIANESIEENMLDLEEIVKNSLLKPEEFYFSVSVSYDEVSGNYIQFGYDEILRYDKEFLEEKILLFCKEASDSYSVPNAEEVIYEIEIGDKQIVFSASDECLELFEELRKYY